MWGGLHGLALVIHRLWSVRVDASRLPAALRAGYHATAWLLTSLFVGTLWVPFRAASFADTVVFLTRMFTLADGTRWLHSPTLLLLAFMAAWHLMKLIPNSLVDSVPAERPLAWRPLWVIGALLMALAMFAPQNSAPFVYFQF